MLVGQAHGAKMGAVAALQLLPPTKTAAFASGATGIENLPREASTREIRYRGALLLGTLRFLAFLLSEHPVRLLLLRQEEPCHSTADEYDHQVRRQRIEPYVKRRREA